MRTWLRRAVIAFVLLGAADHADALSITRAWPADGERVGDSVLVATEISSGFDITSTATLGGQTLPLDYLPQVCIPMFGCTPRFARVFLLNGQTPGPLPLVIDVQDSSGAMQQITRTIIYAPIHVTVTSPQVMSVMRGSVRFIGTCDQAGGPCPMVHIGVGRPSMGPAPTYYVDLTNVTTFDVPIDLGAYDGMKFYVVVTGTDGTVTTYNETLIGIESSPHLQPMVYVPGQVRDVSGPRVLYESANGGSLHVFHRDTGVTDLLSIGGSRPRLTPRGAIWTEGSAAVLYELRDGVVLDHGALTQGTELDVNGSYVLFTRADGLHRLDMTTGTIVTVTPDPSPSGPPRVGPSGDVVWVDANAHVHLRSGAGADVDLGPGRSPDTDGSLVSISADDISAPCESWVQTPLGAPEALVTNETCCPAPPAEVFDGWVGFTRLNTVGVRQAWVRTPSGIHIQLTALTQGGLSVVFGPDSAAIFHLGGSYIYDYAGTVLQFSQHPDTHLYRDGEWLVVILGEVFTIDASPPPPADAGVPDASTSSDGGALDAGVSDASSADASLVDGALIDAPAIDAQVIDAPVIDGEPADAPPVDAADAGDETATDESGCGCRTADRADAVIVLCMLALLLLRRRNTAGA